MCILLEFVLRLDRLEVKHSVPLVLDLINVDNIVMLRVIEVIVRKLHIQCVPQKGKAFLFLQLLWLLLAELSAQHELPVIFSLAILGAETDHLIVDIELVVSSNVRQLQAMQLLLFRALRLNSVLDELHLNFCLVVFLRVQLSIAF